MAVDLGEEAMVASTNADDRIDRAVAHMSAEGRLAAENTTNHNKIIDKQLLALSSLGNDKLARFYY